LEETRGDNCRTRLRTPSTPASCERVSGSLSSAWTFVFVVIIVVVSVRDDGTEQQGSSKQRREGSGS
jgi:hypothetical protein